MKKIKNRKRTNLEKNNLNISDCFLVERSCFFFVPFFSHGIKDLYL